MISIGTTVQSEPKIPKNAVIQLIEFSPQSETLDPFVIPILFIFLLTLLDLSYSSLKLISVYLSFLISDNAISEP